MSKGKKKLRVIPLGGLQEIGKNITAFEYGDDIVVVDCGLSFPEDEMLGIDLVIPDVTYLVKNKEKVRAIVLTHGHEDHIGALPYVLRELNVPVYGTKLTIGLIKCKLEEHNLLDTTDLRTVCAGQTIDLGAFKVEFIHTTHSIADAVSLAIHTPIGVIVHTGDFKIDYTPIQGETMDLARFAELGKKGVLLLMCDSTNIENEGYTMSERTVGDTFNEIFADCKGRILVATFASNVHRVQQVINSAVKFGRKVTVIGRSMVNVVNVAMELGYLIVPEGVIVDMENMDKVPQDKLVIITTGSQGETMSALTRITFGEHKKVEIIPGDLVIISASPIPGNEKLISRVVNELFKKGAKVIYEALADIHVSGHACQEEIKLIHNLVKPKFFMPVHGEHRHLRQHTDLAIRMGMQNENVFILENGKVLELTHDSAKINGSVTAGRVLVDGLGVGDVGNVVLRDRRHLSQDGLIVVVITIEGDTGNVVAGPDIISRGFVYVRESEDLMEQIKEIAKQAVNKSAGKSRGDWSIRKSAIREDLKDCIYQKTKRKPMILPIIMEI